MFILAALALSSLVASPACAPASGDARDILRRVADRVGLHAAESRVLHVQGFDVISNDYQSDRMYAPYISSVSTFDSWFFPTTGVERTSTRTSIAGTSYGP